MVVDPFSALSLAANIIQFLDFGQKLLSKGREIYKSSDGASTAHVEIELVYDDLWTIARSLAPHTAPSPAGSTDTIINSSSSIGDDQIGRLAASCQAVAQDLLTIVRELKLDPEAKHRKWQSFRQALKSVGKQSRISELQERLSEFRGELTIRLAAILGDRQSVILQEVQNLSNENIRMDLNQSRRLDDLSQHIEDVRVSVVDSLSVTATKANLTDLAHEIRALATNGAQLSKEQRILSTLCYRYMHTRFTNVAIAYNETFNWIFDSECDVGFVQWLERSDGIYWISGKPGSGKSTLMRYLCEHATTQMMLDSWAGEADLVTASFFFWSVGTQMQKSQEGLLRSLIFAILKQCPDFIPKVCAPLWILDGTDDSAEDFWTLEQLHRTMCEIILHDQTACKFCFFIDGLDEYAGQHVDVVRTLQTLAKSPCIKICASSRPWNIFEDTFGQVASKKLYLEELTREDIEIYVRSKLQEHTHQALFTLEDVGVEDLVQEITTRAQGVFLWVHLVILSLCDGLTNGDDVGLLQDRLKLIPTDLERFFRLILDSVDKIYKDKMAHTFQVVLESSEPLTLISLSFLDQKDLDALLRESVKPMDKYEIYDRHAKMKRRINGRYKGLLEVTAVPSAIDYFGYRVDFFHRTVHDFIRLNDIQQLLQSYLPSDFSAQASICKVLLVTMRKMLLRRPDVERQGQFQIMLLNFMYHARLLESETSTASYDLVEEMEITISELYDVYRIRACRNFVDLAIRSGLQLYVCQRLSDDPESVRQYLHPFLQSLLQSLSASLPHDYSASTVPEVVEFLLHQGVDPNYPSGNSTVFGEYLLETMNPAKYSTIQLSRSGAIIGQQYYVLTLLMRHRANANAAHSAATTIWRAFLRDLYNNGRRHSAAHQKIFVNILKCLIAHGADLEVEVQGADVQRIVHKSFVPNSQRSVLRMLKTRRRKTRHCTNIFQACVPMITAMIQSLRTFGKAIWKMRYSPPSRIVDEESTPLIHGLYGNQDRRRRRWLW